MSVHADITRTSPNRTPRTPSVSLYQVTTGQPIARATSLLVLPLDLRAAKNSSLTVNNDLDKKTS